MIRLITLIMLSVFLLYAQEKDDYITVVGDSLLGRMVDGESIREVIGDVVLTQGDVVITCKRAIQFISRNDAELIGDVVVTQDSLTITTPHAFYYGDLRRAESTAGVHLDDKKVILTADTGDYFFNEDKAFFRNNVRLFDTTTVLTSHELTYLRNEDRMIASGNVKIVDSANIIEADRLQHYRRNRVTIADENVRISSLMNNVVIYGDHLEDYAERFYTIVDENPLLVQIDTTYMNRDTLFSGENNGTEIELDTLIIKSLIMESLRDKINVFTATDSVEIWRGGFASRNDKSTYYRNDGRIITSRISRDAMRPVLWSDNSQLTGDSVVIHLENNRIKLMEVWANAFIISKSIDFPARYDQISGDSLLMHFTEGEIEYAEVSGSVYSIYYLYEDSLPNGANKSSAQNAEIYFSEKKVQEVHLFGLPVSEYYPEHLVFGKEQSFTLPGFEVHQNRPSKNLILRRIFF